MEILSVLDINGLIIPLCDVTQISTNPFSNEESMMQVLGGVYPTPGTTTHLYIAYNNTTTAIELNDMYNRKDITTAGGMYADDYVVRDQIVEAWIKLKNR